MPGSGASEKSQKSLLRGGQEGPRALPSSPETLKKGVSIAVVIASLLLAAGTQAALLKVGNLVLRGDGGFTPRMLPRHGFAPIAFEGHADIRAVDGSVPPALQQVVLDFDRDGRLSTAGLPTCDPSRLQEATPAEARAKCATAIVGTGHVRALIKREGGPPYDVTAPVTLFNGAREGGDPTVIFHTRTTVPATQNFVIVIPIERRRGSYRYRVTFDVPPISAGRGSLVHIDIHVGRRYRYRGVRRSYVSARCSDNVLSTRAHFTFVDGTVLAGSVEKACTFR